MFWNIYSSAFIKKEQIFGWTNGFCIMPMHLPAQNSDFWPKK